jgi:hypothetical protein
MSKPAFFYSSALLRQTPTFRNRLLLARLFVIKEKSAKFVGKRFYVPEIHIMYLSDFCLFQL